MKPTRYSVRFTAQRLLPYVPRESLHQPLPLFASGRYVLLLVTAFIVFGLGLVYHEAAGITSGFVNFLRGAGASSTYRCRSRNYLAYTICFLFYFASGSITTISTFDSSISSMHSETYKATSFFSCSPMFSVPQRPIKALYFPFSLNKFTTMSS